MEKIGLVADSTCDLPLSYYREHDVMMVPLIVRFGDEIYRDWQEIEPSEFYNRLRKVSVLPKTSQPTVADFIQAYEELKRRGCTHIVSVHLSAKLSGTVGSAEAARQQVDIPVEVVDTKMVSGGIALILHELVQMRDMGKSFAEITERAHKLADIARGIAYFTTLKYLEMGGRIGKAQAFVGTLLDVKPILTLSDGIVAPYKRVRGIRRVIPEIVKSFRSEVEGASRIRVAIAHGDNKEGLEKLREAIQNLDLPVEIVFPELEIGSVIGTYTGPGAVMLTWLAE